MGQGSPLPPADSVVGRLADGRGRAERENEFGFGSKHLKRDDSWNTFALIWLSPALLGQPRTLAPCLRAWIAWPVPWRSPPARGAGLPAHPGRVVELGARVQEFERVFDVGPGDRHRLAP